MVPQHREYVPSGDENHYGDEEPESQPPGPLPGHFCCTQRSVVANRRPRPKGSRSRRGRMATRSIQAISLATARGDSRDAAMDAAAKSICLGMISRILRHCKSVAGWCFGSCSTRHEGRYMPTSETQPVFQEGSLEERPKARVAKAGAVLKGGGGDRYSLQLSHVLR